ncbi:MAG: hypothetical protein ACM3N0_09535 [Chloroflexota bacterium]
MSAHETGQGDQPASYADGPYTWTGGGFHFLSKTIDDLELLRLALEKGEDGEYRSDHDHRPAETYLGSIADGGGSSAKREHNDD